MNKYSINTDLSNSYRNHIIYTAWKSGMTQTELAKLFGIRQASIGYIVKKMDKLEYKQSKYRAPFYDNYTNESECYQITLNMIIEGVIL